MPSTITGTEFDKEFEIMRKVAKQCDLKLSDAYMCNLKCGNRPISIMKKKLIHRQCIFPTSHISDIDSSVCGGCDHEPEVIKRNLIPLSKRKPIHVKESEW